MAFLEDSGQEILDYISSGEIVLNNRPLKVMLNNLMKV
jgi:hypothetical protein